MSKAAMGPSVENGPITSSCDSRTARHIIGEIHSADWIAHAFAGAEERENGAARGTGALYGASAVPEFP